MLILVLFLKYYNQIKILIKLIKLIYIIKIYIQNYILKKNINKMDLKFEIKINNIFS